jgi:hypothetical protein
VGVAVRVGVNISVPDGVSVLVGVGVSVPLGVGVSVASPAALCVGVLNGGTGGSCAPDTGASLDMGVVVSIPARVSVDAETIIPDKEGPGVLSSTAEAVCLIDCS